VDGLQDSTSLKRSIDKRYQIVLLDKTNYIAIEQAKHLAKNFKRMERGKHVKPFTYRNKFLREGFLIEN